nr:hypothetical protein [Acidobacteriota bacterium]
MHRILRSSAFGVSLLVMAASASAQSARSERPYRGLFAGGTGDVGRSLIASGSLSAGYLNNVLDEGFSDGSIVGPIGGSAQRGALTQASALLGYSQNSSKLSIDASVATSVRHLLTGNQPLARGLQARLGFSVPLHRRTTFSAGTSVMYQPYVYTS